MLGKPRSGFAGPGSSGEEDQRVQLQKILKNQPADERETADVNWDPSSSS
jgi:hypothetical protein